jgi:short subunit dehydrogenase-like uncharacterized protein
MHQFRIRIRNRLIHVSTWLQVVAQVSFGDPGYLFTSKMFIQTALTLLQERPKIAAAVGASGGVFTVGALFRHSSLIDRLQQAGVKFTVKQQS